MGLMAPLDWNVTKRICPEFYPDGFDFFWAAVAIYGIVCNVILIRRFKTQLNASVFLFALAIVDMGYCVLYIYTYFFKSLTMYFESDIAAEILIRLMSSIKTLEEFGHLFMPILILMILLERLVWTSPKRMRSDCRCLTDPHNKMIMVLAAIFYSVIGAILATWNMMDSETQFCDVILLPIPPQNYYLHFLVETLIPSFSISVGIFLFLLSLTVLCRVTRVGKDLKNNTTDEQVELSDMQTPSIRTIFPTISAHSLRRSILAMLLVYFFFFIRGFCYNVFANPKTTTILELNRNARIMRTWSYDILNLLASSTRYLIYWSLIDRDMIVDYPLNPKR